MRRWERAGQRRLFTLGEGGEIVIPIVLEGLPPKCLEWSERCITTITRYARNAGYKMRLQPDDIEDLVSECLIKGHKAVVRGKIRYPSAFQSMCWNRGLDMVRKASRAKEVVNGQVVEYEGVTDGGIGNELISQVSEMFPELVVMAKLLAEGYSKSEAAQELGMDEMEFSWKLQSLQAEARGVLGE